MSSSEGSKLMPTEVPEETLNAVLVKSVPLPTGTPIIKGYDFNKGINYHALLETYISSGFQATSFGQAVDEVRKMLLCRRQPLPEDKEDDSYEEDEFIKRRSNCTIFLGYTSNMVSSGVRESIRFLAQHRMIDCIVTTAGGVEEDLIKCLGHTYLGEFSLDGRRLREKGINRIGNLLVPNENYCRFEDWVMPILDKMLIEQKENMKVIFSHLITMVEDGMTYGRRIEKTMKYLPRHAERDVLWTPSRVIARLGEEIDDSESICYWAAKNKIPIFSPALTDGSLGDMMYMHSYRNPGLVVDIIQDLRRLNSMAVKAANTGMIILGGGVVKHHICNANLMRNGANYSVFINTASEFDGSDSGARPDEAISWGKIRMDASPVKVYADASLVFPLLVGETFARQHQAEKDKVESTV